MSIDNLVYGHAQAKKAIRALLRRSKEYYENKVLWKREYNKKPLKLLLIGQSGTGKTHLMESFSKLYDFPLLKLDATSFTPTGNQDGMNAKQLRKKIKDNAVWYVNNKDNYHSLAGAISRTVIFVDEFDKLGNRFDSSGNWNQHVQANFLTLIDAKDEFKGVSWVFAGAFSSLFQTRVRRSIGFHAEEIEETSEITDKDIIRAGIIPEMLGRISLIVELDKFTKDDYEKILINQLLPNYPDLTEINIKQIVHKAYHSGQGIRCLTRQLEMLQIDHEHANCEVKL